MEHNLIPYEFRVYESIGAYLRLYLEIRRKTQFWG